MFTSKGVHGSWDRLGDISAASNVLRAAKKRLGRELKTIYRGRTHKVPDLSKSVWKVSRRAIETRMLEKDSPDDLVDAKYKVVDILGAGEKSLRSSTLGSFNKKVRSLSAGILTTDDGENTESLPVYSGGYIGDDDIFETSDEDDENERADGTSDSDGEDNEMSDSDTLLED